jgi:hypothetical protein
MKELKDLKSKILNNFNAYAQLYCLKAILKTNIFLCFSAITVQTKSHRKGMTMTAIMEDQGKRYAFTSILSILK